MLQRFVAGTAIASVAIAIGALAVLLISTPNFSKLTTIWCFVPLAWGVWAVCTPSSWIPERIHIWGTILGIIAGTSAVFVLNIPYRVLGITLPVTTRVLLLIVAVAFYYLLWRLVRSLYCSIAPTPTAYRTKSNVASQG